MARPMQPPGAIDRYRERHSTPLPDRLKREYPDLYAGAERRATEEERAACRDEK